MVVSWHGRHGSLTTAITCTCRVVATLRQYANLARQVFQSVQRWNSIPTLVGDPEFETACSTVPPFKLQRIADDDWIGTLLGWQVKYGR